MQRTHSFISCLSCSYYISQIVSLHAIVFVILHVTVSSVQAAVGGQQTLRRRAIIWPSFCCRSASSPRPQKSTRRLEVMESMISSLKGSSTIFAAKGISRSAPLHGIHGQSRS